MLSALATGFVSLALLAPAHAEKGESKVPKAPAALRCARSYAEAMAEAKDRGCVVFVTLHRDG